MIAIVTATLDWPTAQDCAATWLAHARGPIHLYIVGQKVGSVQQIEWDTLPAAVPNPNVRMHGYRTPEILGVVPAYAIGVQRALDDGHDLIACLHDDVDIMEPAWDVHVTQWFETHPQTGLLGFGGGIGLGDPDIYQKPYDPMQLARRGFVSNMRDANAHGARSLQPIQVACLDGFSQIGRREYWQRWKYDPAGNEFSKKDGGTPNLFQDMADWGIIHHAYDAALGCFARRLGWDVYMLPIACHHYGGRTAVANTDYQKWANDKGVVRDTRGVMAAGDQGFWLKAHQIVYNQFRDVLPID